MKKQLVKILMVIGCGLILIPAGCKKSMDELNVNPNAPVSVSPDYLFTYSVVRGQGSYITNANLHYWLLMNWDMYFANLGGVDAGKEYDSNDGKDAYWNEVYAQALMNAKEVERLTANDPYLINKNAIARIWEAYLFSKLRNTLSLQSSMFISLSITQFLDTFFFTYGALSGLIENLAHIVFFSYLIKLITISAMTPMTKAMLRRAS